MKKLKREVPGAGEWAGYEADLDVRYAYKLLFGKTIVEAQAYFGGVHSIERADELLYMPRGAFQYYVLAFAEFVTSQNGLGDPDSASPFLHLLVNREKRDPGSVAQIYAELEPSVHFIASNQARYAADSNIYGSFADTAQEIRSLCGGRSGAA